MKAKRMFKVGDVVVVKPDVFDPDFKIPLGGWQGRISAINPSHTVLRIDWDSITLQQMPADIVERCQSEGLYWHYMSLYAEEVELTAARDTEKDAIAMFKAIQQGRVSPGSLEAGEAPEPNGKNGKALLTQSLWNFPRLDYADHIW
ncbi:MAG: hypothetical protein F6K30_08405 [Cyanothece sp. SIO2G6]|nr:hypothetical protein [Cyanothece sp. SIO2G6]